MATNQKVTTDLLDENFTEIDNSYLPNPLYGKGIYFFKGCVKTIIDRNQLLGYLGAFSSSTLNSDVNICVIPYFSFNSLTNGEVDDVINSLNEKLHSYSEQTNRYSNSIPSILILAEHKFFQLIKEKLLKNDEVKIDQFKRLNFGFEI